MTAAPVVQQEVMGSTDDAGKLRGTSLVEFDERLTHLVQWWETRGEFNPEGGVRDLRELTRFRFCLASQVDD